MKPAPNLQSKPWERLSLRPAGLLLPLVGLVVATACGTGDDRGNGASATGGTAVLCIASQPESLNAFASPDLHATDLVPVLFTPLLRYGEGTTFEPWLAREWSWSDDLLELQLLLRDDVVWHDGEPLTAEDVVWTIRTATDPEFAYWQGEDFARLDTIHTSAPGVVTLRLVEPDAALMEAVGRLPILPRHLLEDLSAEEFGRAPYHREPVGSGPYQFVERRTDGSIVLGRNDRYPEDLGRGALGRILIRPIPELTSQLVALRTGSVHGCVTGPGIAEEVDAAESVRGLVSGPYGVQILALRVDRPPVDDPRVRRALSAALDRADLARLSSPLAEPAATFMPRSSPFRSDTILQPDSDPERAAILLDSAGWRFRGRNDIRTDPGGRPLRLTLTGPQQYQDMLTLVQAQLRRVGVDAELRLLEGSAYIGLLQNPEQRPTVMAIILSPAKVQAFDPFSDLHSEGFTNLAGYSNPQVDSLVERLSRTVAPEERRSIYHQLQRRIAEDVPTLYTIYIPRLLAVRHELQGVEVDPAGPFANVTEWRLDR
jgi:peptide/nickel transport system substrate-binding protein